MQNKKLEETTEINGMTKITESSSSDANDIDEAKYNITDAEWKIMCVLWKKPDGRMTLGEIREELKSICSWNINTVRTLLVRLAEKNIIGMSKEGRNHRYYSIVKQDDCVIQETKSLLSRVFGGSPSLMFSALIKSGSISESERGEILQLIDSMKTGVKGDDEDA